MQEARFHAFSMVVLERSAFITIPATISALIRRPLLAPLCRMYWSAVMADPTLVDIDFCLGFQVKRLVCCRCGQLLRRIWIHGGQIPARWVGGMTD